METFFALLALWAGNSTVNGEFPAPRPVTRSFDVFFDLRPNKRCANHRDAGDLRRRRAHHDVTVMIRMLEWSQPVSLLPAVGFYYFKLLWRWWTCYVDWLLDHNELRMVLWSTPHNALTSLRITSTCFCLKLQVWASLLWGHNGRDGVSNHQPRDCLLNRSFRRRSKKTLKLRVTVLCAGNSPVTSEFPAQMASNAENVSIWWRHHVFSRSLPLWSTTI